MLAVLSPAKALDETRPDGAFTTTQPVLLEEAERLMKTLRGLSQKKIRALMNLSEPLGKLNYERYQTFHTPFTDGNALPAAMTFNGEVYRGLGARTLSPDELVWAGEHVAILSGLYGLLRPLDLMQPYRLEMGTKLKTRRGENLYKFWGERITDEINGRLEAHDDTALVNLASNEYFKSVKRKSLNGDIVTCVFEDYKEHKDEGTVISFMAKHARGLMARYMITERVDRREGLKDFALERYRFVKKRSSDDKYIFARKFVPVAAKRAKGGHKATKKKSKAAAAKKRKPRSAA